MLGSIVDAHLPIDRCVRLLAQVPELSAWLHHSLAVLNGLRAPVDFAPPWYDLVMISLFTTRKKAESAYVQAVAKEPKK